MLVIITFVIVIGHHTTSTDKDRSLHMILLTKLCPRRILTLVLIASSIESVLIFQFLSINLNHIESLITKSANWTSTHLCTSRERLRYPRIESQICTTRCWVPSTAAPSRVQLVECLCDFELSFMYYGASCPREARTKRFTFPYSLSPT